MPKVAQILEELKNWLADFDIEEPLPVWRIQDKIDDLESEYE